MKQAAHIEIQALSKHYEGRGRHRLVLDHIDTRIAHGEFVVLVGRSGSGKSTLLNLLGGLDRPSTGDVLLDGQSLVGLSEDALSRMRRHKIGYVFQFFNLVPTLTVAENLGLPLELVGVSAADAEVRIKEWLSAVGLAGRGPDYPDELSGGEQQRVALARALVHQPGLLLADEPTGNLDLHTAREVLRLLDELCRRSGTTLIMATHSDEVIGLADRVLTIREGRLVATEGARGS
ncbi:MAG: ABC transporter ATP-binding protein [Gammaproteobacteria bacterium]